MENPSKLEKKQVNNEAKSERINCRVYPDEHAFVTYWKDEFDMSMTEFLMESARHYVKWRCQDYDLPTAEIQRLNQMIDAVQSLTANQERLTQVVTSGFDSMIGIMRGDNYLVDEDKGGL